MRRLAVQLVADVTLQYRSGFYAVSLIVAVPAALLLRFLDDAALGWVLPLVLFQNTFINTFFFVAGLTLLERDEDTLGALWVTPLRQAEYLASKVITLSTLSVLEGLFIAMLTFGGDLDLLLLMVGLACEAVLLTLLGLLVMTRYASINEFLMPSVAYTIFLCLPLVHSFGLLEGAWIRLHPLQPAMEALAGGFTPVHGSLHTYGLLASLPWILAAAVLAARSFRRQVVGAA